MLEWLNQKSAEYANFCNVCKPSLTYAMPKMPKTRHISEKKSKTVSPAVDNSLNVFTLNDWFIE